MRSHPVSPPPRGPRRARSPPVRAACRAPLRSRPGSARPGASWSARTRARVAPGGRRRATWRSTCRRSGRRAAPTSRSRTGRRAASARQPCVSRSDRSSPFCSAKAGKLPSLQGPSAPIVVQAVVASNPIAHHDSVSRLRARLRVVQTLLGAVERPFERLQANVATEAPSVQLGSQQGDPVLVVVDVGLELLDLAWGAHARDSSTTSALHPRTSRTVASGCTESCRSCSRTRSSFSAGFNSARSRAVFTVHPALARSNRRLGNGRLVLVFPTVALDREEPSPWWRWAEIDLLPSPARSRGRRGICCVGEGEPHGRDRLPPAHRITRRSAHGGDRRDRAGDLSLADLLRAGAGLRPDPPNQSP